MAEAVLLDVAQSVGLTSPATYAVGLYGVYAVGADVVRRVKGDE